MDDDGGVNVGNMSESDRREIEAFVKTTNAQIGINKIVHQLTDSCWKKCITTPIKSGVLDSRERSCAANCVARWLDTQTAVIKTLAEEEGRKRLA